MTHLAVVPIVMTAAVLPAILAGVTSVIALIFRPRELLRACRRKPVRATATAEDMAEASMAGQYKTFLDITGEEAVIDAVQRCWASLNYPRTRAYLANHNIDRTKVAMAVAVQKLIPSDVAGVLFTANPHGDVLHEMLIEASWGLGESVVSGRVQPDILRLRRADGVVLSTGIGTKQFMIAAGSHAPAPNARKTLGDL